MGSAMQDLVVREAWFSDVLTVCIDLMGRWRCSNPGEVGEP